MPARISLRLAAYFLTSPAVVRGLLEAKRRGVDIPIRVVSAFAIHHDKCIVVDARHTETGSFSFSQAAATASSENVLVVWNKPKVASTYLAPWDSRWTQGIAVELSY